MVIILRVITMKVINQNSNGDVVVNTIFIGKKSQKVQNSNKQIVPINGVELRAQLRDINKRIKNLAGSDIDRINELVSVKKYIEKKLCLRK